MEYKYEPDNFKVPHWLKFIKEEAEAVRAMYIESAVTRIEHGNTDFVSDFENYLVESADRRNKGLRFGVSDLNGLAAELENFFESTDLRMQEIASMDIPKHKNFEAIRRKKLGMIAGQLAVTLRAYADNRSLSI